MNIRQSIVSIVSLIAAVALLGACSGDPLLSSSSTGHPPVTQTCNVIMPDGLPAVGLAQLAYHTAGLDNYEFQFEVVSTPDALIASVIKGEPDIAVVPSNAAASQYNKGAGYVIAGTVSNGSSFLVTTDDSIQGVADLAGKTVYNIGRGLTPDLVFRTLLGERSIDLESIDFTYVSAASELLPAVISGQATIAVVPEPALSTLMSKKPELRIVADLNALWKESFGSATGFPQATLIVKEELARSDPAFVNDFMDKVASSERAVYDDPDSVAASFETLGISVDPAALASSDRFNLVFTPAADAQGDYMTYFEALHALDPATIGGKIPDAAIFHTTN